MGINWTGGRRRLLTPAIAATIALGMGLARPADAQQLCYLATTPGAIVATGNTLGLSKELNANGPGVEDSIGTFITLGNGQDLLPPDFINPWPAGTTSSWLQDGSAADLVIPGDTDIQYAELIWGGGYNYVEDVTFFLDSSVTLATNGASTAVAPDPATSLTLAQMAMGGFAVNYYARSADVTAFVKAHGAGTYSVSGVPATQNETINALNAAGWTLIVAYRDTSQPIRNLSIFVGGSFVDENSQQDYVVSGFCAPPAGPIGGKAAISALEGDANRTGDQLLIAPSLAGPFVNLSGPNNPQDNFFCSQLNDSNGNLDTKGTFGMANQDAINGLNVSGGRQGWDVTSVPLSSAAGQLVAGQKSAVLRTITTGDSYVPTLAAFEIDVNAPNFTGGKTAISTNTMMVKTGDKITVNVVLDNQGQATATNVKFKMPLQSGLSLTGFKSDGVMGDVNGMAVVANDLIAGVVEGSLAPMTSRTVAIDMDVTGAPPMGTQFDFAATWSYDFVTCQGDPPLSETFDQFANVAFIPPMNGSGGAGGAGGSGNSSSTGTASASGGSGGTGSSVGGSGTGTSAGGNGTGTSTGGKDTGSGNGVYETGADQTGGCGCTTPGQSSDAPWLGIGAALFVLAGARRRRSRVS